MYLNNKNFYHGIMFHHFHDNKKYKQSQGSITKDDFYKLIKFIGQRNILNADVFYQKLLSKKLKKNHVCLTFDDGLKSQFDIALPVLEDLNIKGFFFVSTSVFGKKQMNLELFRHFRTNYFKSIDDFYLEFYKILNKDLKKFFATYKNQINIKKKKCPFYSLEDIKFRFVRDIYLSGKDYDKNMYNLFKEKKFDPLKLNLKFHFSSENLIKLNSLNHTIGIHSHNHPTLLENLSIDKQKREYTKSISKISKILKKKPDEIKTLAHPNGSYNIKTLKILKNLGLKLGFKSTPTIDHDKGMKKINNSSLEIARYNHSVILKQINR